VTRLPKRQGRAIVGLRTSGEISPRDLAALFEWLVLENERLNRIVEQLEARIRSR
jgi:hypothetical protein